MAGEGRIQGRVNGDRYALLQAGDVKQSIPLDDARADKKLLAAIKRNGWEPIS